MKKQRKKTKTKVKSEKTVPNPPAKSSLTRRQLILYAQTGALTLGVLGGGGFLFARSVKASMAEQDLSKIGNGTPAVVQIHDPQCSLCLGLQKETRNALKEFDDDALTYLVANIKTPAGRKLANQYGVPHVTLLLFDAAGELKHVLNGSNTAANLERAFRTHLIDGG